MAAPGRLPLRCTYSRSWTHIKSAYGVNVTAAEHDQLNTMLDTCY
ncbi:hypothetical protein [Streptomyces sp. NPDC059874]